MVAAAAGGVVGERTVRNWLANRTTPDPELLDKIRRASLKQLREELQRNGWDEAGRNAFVAGLDACPGFVSGFAFSFQYGSGEYPAFVQLARQIDLLELALAVHCADGNVRGWVQTLFGTAWILDEHLAGLDDSASAKQTRRQLQDAASWEDLDQPVRLLIANLQLQLLATLDLEFCNAYLPCWEATPVFASLLPRLNQRADFAGKTSFPTTRDLFRYPTRRLLDMTACMRAMRADPTGRWPSTIPPAEDMVRWLDLVGRDKLASNLSKWRSGRALTVGRFEDLWSACFAFIPEATRPSAPMPMLYAATVFTEMFVRGSLADGDLTFVCLDPAYYRRWWELQHQALQAGPRPPRFGTEKWMPGLS